MADGVVPEARSSEPRNYKALPAYKNIKKESASMNGNWMLVVFYSNLKRLYPGYLPKEWLKGHFKRRIM